MLIIFEVDKKNTTFHPNKKGAQLSLPRCSSKASATAFRPFCCTWPHETARLKHVRWTLDLAARCYPSELVGTIIFIWISVKGLIHSRMLQATIPAWDHDFEPREVSETLRKKLVSLTSSVVGGFNLLGRLWWTPPKMDIPMVRWYYTHIHTSINLYIYICIYLYWNNSRHLSLPISSTLPSTQQPKKTLAHLP